VPLWRTIMPWPPLLHWGGKSCGGRTVKTNAALAEREAPDLALAGEPKQSLLAGLEKDRRLARCQYLVVHRSSTGQSRAPSLRALRGRVWSGRSGLECRRRLWGADGAGEPLVAAIGIK
jgi:hypothetical protein